MDLSLSNRARKRLEHLAPNEWKALEELVNRLYKQYYTVFHTASAVLLWLDVERTRHSRVQSAFGELLVKPGIIEPEFGRIFARARKAREEQDCQFLAEPLKETDAEEILKDAESFTIRMERYLREVCAKP